MFASLVIAAMEASIIPLEANTLIMMQMEHLFVGPKTVRGERDLIRDKFLMLQRAFTDALSDPTQVKTGQDLRSIIRNNYECLSAEEYAARSISKFDNAEWPDEARYLPRAFWPAP
jgi:hypothetical protein